MSKILVSVDARLLVRIDRAARSAGLTRSAYLASLAERDLGAARGPGASKQAKRALTRMQRLFDAHGDQQDATTVVRTDRDRH